MEGIDRVMNAPLFQKRAFRAFLSHSHADKKVVSSFYTFLKEVAKIPVWYDQYNLTSSTQISTGLAESITKCQSMIIVLSKDSVSSGWVKEEYNFAVGQRAQVREFSIIPVVIDECPIPGFLQTTKWIDLRSGRLDAHSAYDLLTSFYYDDQSFLPEMAKDIYISRGWRQQEMVLADEVCQYLDQAGFRLIGDSETQHTYDIQRITSIISSCGGLVAILPDRGGGTTSNYILQEIEIAQDLMLPNIIVTEPSVQVPQLRARAATDIVVLEPDGGNENTLQAAIGKLQEAWIHPPHPHYIFIATSLSDQRKESNQLVKQLIQTITAQPCIIGDDIRQGQIQQTIREQITHAFVVIADISQENINSCIEAGYALGANKILHLLASGPRHRAPFMLSDQQVWYYDDETELLGRIHALVAPYRRHILNPEIALRGIL
jgi:TIR domain